MAREQGVVAAQNPRHNIEDSDKQLEPDVVFYFGFGPTVETDITIINPNAPSYMARSLTAIPGSGLATAEGRKNNKYDHSAYRRGRQFLALAFETQGRASQNIIALLKRFAAHTEPGNGLAVGDMMMARAWQCRVCANSFGAGRTGRGSQTGRRPPSSKLEQYCEVNVF